MKHLKQEAGFTLVEVLVAIFLLATAVLGAAAMTAAIITGNAYSGRVSQASILAQDKMEELMGLPYQKLTNEEECDADLHQDMFRRCRKVNLDVPDMWTATIEVYVSFPWKGSVREVRIAAIRSR